MSDIVESLGVLAASLANPQVAVEAQREIERLRAENAKLKVLLRESILYLGHTHYPVSLPTRIRAAIGDEPNA